MTLGLADVLLNPQTMEVFTPNTGQTTALGEVRADNYKRDSRGRFAGNGGGGGGGSSSGGNSSESVDKSAKSDIIESKKTTTFEEYIKTPSLLGKTTPSEKFKQYKEAGFEVRPFGNGNLKGISFEDGGGYRVYFDKSMQKTLMYHPAKRSHHEGEYYKLSDGEYGIHRFRIDGTQID